MKKEIKITVSNTGLVSLDIQNAKGKDCLKWSKGLEIALGANPASLDRQLKSTFYEAVDNDQDVSDDQPIKL